MSITFTADSPIVGYEMVCCDGVHRDTRTWPADATTDRIEREHAARCVHPACVHQQGGILELIYEVPVRPVQLSNANARRVLTALALAPQDEGMPSVERHGARGGRSPVE